MWNMFWEKKKNNKTQLSQFSSIMQTSKSQNFFTNHTSRLRIAHLYSSKVPFCRLIYGCLMLHIRSSWPLVHLCNNGDFSSQIADHNCLNKILWGFVIKMLIQYNRNFLKYLHRRGPYTWNFYQLFSIYPSCSHEWYESVPSTTVTSLTAERLGSTYETY